MSVKTVEELMLGLCLKSEHHRFLLFGCLHSFLNLLPFYEHY